MAAMMSDLIQECGFANPLDAMELMISAASNAGASPDVLAALANSPFTEVRCKVAENGRTPPNVLDTLMYDAEIVRAGLARNPRAIERVWSLVNDCSVVVRLSLAENPNLPEHVYQVLLTDQDAYVAAKACRTLRKLQRDHNPVVMLFNAFAKAS